MPKIRTTLRPGVELDVDDAELTDLTRMGLVLDTKATTPDGLEKAAERQHAARTGSDIGEDAESSDTDTPKED